MFNTTQEAERKEIKRAFGVLQSKFRFLSTANSVELWGTDRIRKIVTASAILYNMAIKDILAERQDGELYVTATAGRMTIYWLGRRMEHNSNGSALSLAPRVRIHRQPFAGMCLAKNDLRSELEWHNLRARLADFIFEVST
jgi:hypothetical protein